ncbi:cutinase family protein [Catenuloplanes atrovinosus]|uniref:Pimeloyl-ACP methyl ester carboxylesterase n=1 Tax=Catenuloplanes atrovinosus TaxID=137266 RepID=A0AAE4CBW3_9ACTN|nr:cutinase family protein [Catenuloplanes atrovinosus]MDR7278502.1 pimeloyl-ACP methyl ester carboxylesterase [Catenuloplanes atrovinosus]
MKGKKLAVTLAGALIVGGGVVAAPYAFAAQAPANDCADVEIIGARGTTERPGLGVVLTPLAQQMTRELPQTVRTTALDYPANFNYAASVRAGVTQLREDIAATAEECPDTRLVLMGYSQGADVVGDTLARLDDDLAGNVASVLLFGDPTFTRGEDFNVTDGTRQGVFPRGAGALDGFADRIQSYCNRNDRFCQSGTSLAAHIDYAGFRDDAIAFTGDRVG